MNASQLKQAAVNRGYNQRLQQLMAKQTAASTMDKQAFGAFAKGLGRAVMDVGRAAKPTYQAMRAGGGSGLGKTLWGNIAPGSQAFLSANKGTLGAMGAGLGGAGAVQGAHSIYDAKRREKLRGLSALQRLMLAGQLVFNPNGAINSMRL